jgi:hypothetical protein
MLFTSAGVPISGATPACKVSLDVPMTSSTGATTNTASATSNLGFSELTLAAADLTADNYVILYCTAGAGVYTTVFKIQQ